MDECSLKRLKDVSILCVEDEDGIRKTVVDTLKYYFDEVYEASDGEIGYEIYEEYRPKIVLSDIQMKNMDGIEFVKKIRKSDLDTTIIMLTAYSNEEYLMDLINLNINHYILKPLNLKKLNEALEKYVSINFSLELKLSKDMVLNLDKSEIVYKESEIIPLRKREKEFLELLHRNKEVITTYEQMELDLWQDKEMTSYALKSFIKELRCKLPVNIIKNVSLQGYVLDKEKIT